MSNGNTEVKLPPLKGTFGLGAVPVADALMQRNDQLREALAQIAALTSQVEELKSENAAITMMLEGEKAIVNRIWKDIGIESYADAKGKSIYELIGGKLAELTALHEGANNEYLIYYVDDGNLVRFFSPVKDQADEYANSLDERRIRHSGVICRMLELYNPIAHERIIDVTGGKG